MALQPQCSNSGHYRPNKFAESQAAAKPVIPDKFTNLKVLPPTIEKSELMAIMKEFSRSFKVRCAHCHVATDDLSSADFPLR